MKNQTFAQDFGEKKKVSLSVGTIVFLAFNFILIAGFCKFSFYVLKNHRSAVTRNELVKTYVDVQPYGVRSKVSQIAAINNKVSNGIPTPFFNKEKRDQNGVTNLARDIVAPLPVEIRRTNTPDIDREIVRKESVSPETKRPPVIKNQAKPIVVSDPVLIQENTDVPESEEPTLEEMMTAGLDLLDESEKISISGRMLLIDPSTEHKAEIPAAMVENTKSASVAAKPVALAVVEKPSVPVKNIILQKKETQKTKWLDIATLRQKIEAEALAEKERKAAENKKLLDMNGQKQSAAVATGVVSDSESPAFAAQKTETPATVAPTIQTAVVQDVPFAGTSQNDTTSQVAVVQDVPFAGTAEKTLASNDVKKEVPTFITSKDHVAALSGNSAGLWKIAKANGVPRNSLAVKNGDIEKPVSVASDSLQPEKKQTLAAAAPKTKKGEIFRNGVSLSEKKANEEQLKSLAWLDRQEAAVWTSMSQSDAPSVWSVAADDSTSPDRAKAFRIAAEQPQPPAPEEKPASAVRVVEEAKTEAKANPLLLPLGSPTVSVGETSAPAPVDATIAPPVVNQNGLQNALNPPAASPAESTPQTSDTKQNENSGIVDKFFSIFNKPETADDLPALGTQPAASRKKEEKNTSKQTAKGTESRPSAASSTASAATVQRESIIPTELRLTFKPNSAEISNQSVKWIKSFGLRAKKDIQSAVEIRMSNQNPQMQEKRFALIRNILIGVGMDEIQIYPVMSDRTPHTVVLRTFKLPEEGLTEYTRSEGGIKEQLYYKQW